MSNVIENAYVILCEADEEMRIPTKKLFDLYDQGKGVLFHSADGDVYIRPFCYFYDTGCTYMFHNIYEYDVAVFKREFKLNLLSDWELKLLQLFHIEWFNELHKMLNSAIFVNILKQIAALRLSETVTPEKELMFTPFKSPILETVLPESITHGHSMLWEPFISECSQVQLKYKIDDHQSRSAKEV